MGAAKYLAAALCALALTMPARAQTPIFPSNNWTASPSFASDTRLSLTGATCLDTELHRCLAVNDATAFAQTLSVTGTTIHPGSPIGVTGDVSAVARPPRIEGVSHDPGFFYAVTTRAKDVGGVQADTSFLVVRFSKDATSRPPPAGLQISEKVRDALNAGIVVPTATNQRLTSTESDIGGIAVKADVVHLGFRAPVFNNRAFILSMPVASLFGAAAFNPTVHAVTFGANTGIVDLTTVAEGVLILTGPTRDQAGPNALFLFNVTTGQATQVAVIADPINRKAEGLLLVQDDPEFFRVVVLYEGLADGAPIEFFVPR